MADLGRTVPRPRVDLRGFGRSPIHSLPITYALDVAALPDRLEIRRAALAGSRSADG
jgi:pimeloyl-ACP methyl ester carboxylesterase